MTEQKTDKRTSSPPKRIGLIGIGLLGSAIAERLLATGHQVVGFDTAADLQTFRDAGGIYCSSIGDVVQSCKRIIFSLPDSNVVQSVIDKIRPNLSDHTIVDTTTGDPETVVEIGHQLRQIDVDYLDATVAGSSQHMRDHEVTILVGGSIHAFDRCKDIFDIIAAKTFFLGEIGSGARMKLVVNLAIGLNRAVLAESLSFGEAFGFDSQQVVEVLINTPAHSDAMDTKGQKMATNDFSPQARLRQHLKDVKLILAAAKGNKARVPLSTLHEDLLQRLVDAGNGDDDNSAIVKAFRMGKSGS